MDILIANYKNNVKMAVCNMILRNSIEMKSFVVFNYIGKILLSCLLVKRSAPSQKIYFRIVNDPNGHAALQINQH